MWYAINSSMLLNIVFGYDVIGYDPWGKPGGGAPLMNDDGKKIANIFGNFGGRKDHIMINVTYND